MDARTEACIRLIRHPVRFRMYLLAKLPSAFFSGIRVRRLDERASEVTVPYTWFSQNPFRSTYFACLAMAAEMSTGVLGMIYVYRRTPRISMLVLNLEATFIKKAAGTTTFSCTEGRAISAAVEKSVATGEAQTIRVSSVGFNNAGEAVAEFFITWSFKAKNSRP
jgi:hypothetical protein